MPRRDMEMGEGAESGIGVARDAAEATTMQGCKFASFRCEAVLDRSAKAVCSSSRGGNSRRVGAFDLREHSFTRMLRSEKSLSASGRPGVIARMHELLDERLSARKASDAPVNDAIDTRPPGFLPGGANLLRKNSSAFFIA